MLLGIGVDIVHLPRIAAIVKRQFGHKFARRILSANELEQWSSLPDYDFQKQVQFLAVRWVQSLFVIGELLRFG
jgi:holo-[acyl-carrier protein] synthase